MYYYYVLVLLHNTSLLHADGQSVVCGQDTALIKTGSCTFMALMVTEYDYEVSWSGTYHKKHNIYASFWLSVGGFRLRKVGNILNVCPSNSDFSLELHTGGRYAGSEAVRVRHWGRGVGVMVTVCPVLAPLLQRGPACWQQNDITRGALCPPFWERWNFAHKGCTALLSPDLSGRSTFENP